MECQPKHHERFRDVAACRHSFRGFCELHSQLPGWDNETYHNCPESIDELPCYAFLNRAWARPTECVYKGTLKDGVACVNSGQCSSGYCLRKDWKGECGVCSPAPRAGDACTPGFSRRAMPRVPCALGLECSEVGVCVAPAGVNEPCGRKGPCEGGLTCVGILVHVPVQQVNEGICKPPVDELGAPCFRAYDPVKDEHTELPPCNAGLGLQCSDRVCKIPEILTTVSARCHNGPFATGVCGPGLICKERNGESKCLKDAYEGEECDDTTLCFGGTCEGGKCRFHDVPTCD